MRRYLSSAMLLSLALFACGEAIDGAASGMPELAREAPAADGGGFRVVYPPAVDEHQAAWQEWLREAQLLETVAEYMSSTLQPPPAVVTLTVMLCGEGNALYDASTQTIILCYELLDYLVTAFSDEPTEEELTAAVIGATLFILYHEVGHALTHVFDLPITGREEDVADQLATYLLIKSGEDGASAALSGAIALGEDGPLDDLAFADEHSLGRQRLFNVACWIYGSDTEAYVDLPRYGWLPENRAPQCEYEYGQIANSWERLLEPHLR